jgi:hypothetical protein
MPWRCDMRIFFIGIIISISSIHFCVAQHSSLEFWPETDIWYRLSLPWRLSAYIPITKYCESKDRDLNIYLQADYAFGKTKYSAYRRLMDENKATNMNAWLARVGFMEGWSLYDEGQNYRERMLYPEIHKRVPLKGNVLMSHRFRTDFRWLGQEPDFSYRLRYRVMVEKEFRLDHSSIVPFFNVEPFWDSRYSTVNRVRVIGGTTVAWGPRFASEVNLTYQYDSRSSVTNVFALNIILHVYFETARVKNGQ